MLSSVPVFYSCNNSCLSDRYAAIMRMVNLTIQMLQMVGKVDQLVTDQDGVHYPHDGLLHCQHHT